MSTEQKTKKRAADPYDSDGGFVELGNKRPKTDKGPSMPKTERKGTASGGQLMDANGDTYWELSKMRRAVLNEFKGKWMVNIREYYEQEGDMKPGKKGISLPLDQFSALVTAIPAIEACLKSCNHIIPRPDYNIRQPTAHQAHEQDAAYDYEDEDDDQMSDTVENGIKSEQSTTTVQGSGRVRDAKTKKQLKNVKKNFEETSDEE